MQLISVEDLIVEQVHVNRSLSPFRVLGDEMGRGEGNGLSNPVAAWENTARWGLRFVRIEGKTRVAKGVIPSKC